MPPKKAARIVLDEDCPPRKILELLSVKWTTMVLHSFHQHGGMCRTGELARSLPGCSKKMLTQNPREMEGGGLLDRKVYAVVPPMVEYSLTPLGRRFVEPLEMLYDWARRNEDAVMGLKKRRKKRTAVEGTRRTGPACIGVVDGRGNVRPRRPCPGAMQLKG